VESLTLAGTLLAADRGARTVRFRLLPYGEPGRTSRGTLTAARGAVTLPPTPGEVILDLEHDHRAPIGSGLAFADHEDHLEATFAILPTRAGDDYLTELEAGARPGVSVELEDVVIRSGVLVAGRLARAGAVATPAFPTAVATLVATDTPTEGDPVTDPTVAPALEPTAEPTAPAAPAPLTATAPAGLPAVTAAAPLTLDRVNALLAARDRGDRSPALLAALSDITHSANVAVDPPQWISEVWSGSPFERQIVPLLGSARLTSLKVTGWRWAVAPVGGDYAGDKTAVPSNAAATEAVESIARRFAGAHDHDRALRDFDPAGYWASYWAAMAASYASWSDGIAATDLVAAAPAVVAASTGVVSAIVSGVLAVLPKGRPTFVLMGAGAYGEMAERDPLAFLSGSISLPDGRGNVGGLTFAASSHVPANDVIVGSRNAITFYELGSTPLRVEAVNIAQGGIDTGAFGYAATVVNDASALAQVTVTAPAPAARSSR
jgi:hypothetical protein